MTRAMLNPAYTVFEGNSDAAIRTIFSVLFPDADTVLDTTFGKGSFWRKIEPAELKITGMDVNPIRAQDLIGDFRLLPFAPGAFDVVVFDPPYQTDMGHGMPSIMGSRYNDFPTIADLHSAVHQGCQEAWRVARLGIIVKCQDYIHASKPVWMSKWVWDAMPAGIEPYDVLYLKRASKLLDPKWTRQLSLWRNHSTFWIYRKDGLQHKEKRP
jgi:hypothetical protein